MRIAMRRGDIKYIRFLINELNGTAIDYEFDSVYFTVKKTPKDRLFLFQKKLGNGIEMLDLGDYQVKIDAKDTSKLVAPADYVFDLQVAYKDLIKETVAFGDFALKSEVTYDENER